MRRSRTVTNQTTRGPLERAAPFIPHLFMKAYDFDCCDYDGEHYCVDCLPGDITPDHEDVSPVFADSEVDCYPVCTDCGEKHTYMSLTSEGAINEAESNNVEIFHVNASTFANCQGDGSWHADRMTENDVDWNDPESVKVESERLAGWYWWTCCPGCMPDSDAFGPFKSVSDAAWDAIN